MEVARSRLYWAVVLSITYCAILLPSVIFKSVVTSLNGASEFELAIFMKQADRIPWQYLEPAANVTDQPHSVLNFLVNDRLDWPASNFGN